MYARNSDTQPESIKSGVKIQALVIVRQEFYYGIIPLFSHCYLTGKCIYHLQIVQSLLLNISHLEVVFLTPQDHRTKTLSHQFEPGEKTACMYIYSETWITRTAGDDQKSLSYGKFELRVMLRINLWCKVYSTLTLIFSIPISDPNPQKAILG